MNNTDTHAFFAVEGASKGKQKQESSPPRPPFEDNFPAEGRETPEQLKKLEHWRLEEQHMFEEKVKSVSAREWVWLSRVYADPDRHLLGRTSH